MKWHAQTPEELIKLAETHKHWPFAKFPSVRKSLCLLAIKDDVKHVIAQLVQINIRLLRVVLVHV